MGPRQLPAAVAQLWIVRRLSRVYESGTQADAPVVAETKLPTPLADEVGRVKIFLGSQAFFLVVSVFTGGFHPEFWSMLDTRP